MRRTRDAGVLGGAVVLAGALTLFGTVLARAIVGAPPGPLTPREPGRAGEPLEVESRGSRAGSEPLAAEVLRAAADRAPFEPDRRAPAERYRLPGERPEVPPVASVPEPPPPPPFRLLGTVAGPDGGVALVQVEGEAPRVLAIGEELLGYRVAAIGGGTAVMSGPGRSLSLTVADAQPTATLAAERDGGRGRSRGREGAADLQRAQQIRERAEEMVRQLRERMGGQVQMQMDGDRVIMIGPDGVRREIQVPAGPQLRFGPDGEGQWMRLQPGAPRTRPGGGGR